MSSPVNGDDNILAIKQRRGMFGVEFLMRRNIWDPPKHSYKKTDDDCDMFVATSFGGPHHFDVLLTHPQAALSSLTNESMKN